jgi:hypothetical protein
MWFWLMKAITFRLSCRSTIRMRPLRMASWSRLLGSRPLLEHTVAWSGIAAGAPAARARLS